MNVQAGCRHFRGDRPCAPHKAHGWACDASCPAFAPRGTRWCIIQLGAMGDVLRSTPVLRAIRAREPTAHVTWVTRFPDLLPEDGVDRVVAFADAHLVMATEAFHVVVNLDKEDAACQLAALGRADDKRGFVWHADGHLVPANIYVRAEWDKFLAGIDDGKARAYPRSYPEDALAIAGFPWGGERYWLPAVPPVPRNRRTIGIAIGCGARWGTRSPSDAWWRELARAVGGFLGMSPVFVGGDQERERMVRLGASFSRRGAFVEPGTRRQFMATVAGLGALVTPVSFAMHVAIGVGTPVVALNNIFAPREFEFYGKGEVVGPSPACECFYAGTCKVGRRCADDYDAGAVAAKAVQWAVGEGRCG